MPLSPGGTLALCVLRWIYEQCAEVLELLKALILAAIIYIDIQITWLKALLAQCDILSQIEELSWMLVQAIIDEIKNALTSFPPGPLAEICPEFYKLFTDPLMQLVDINTSALTIWRERYKTMVSYMDEVEMALAHWEAIKTDLTYTVEVIDDAIYLALMNTAAAVP